MSYQVILATDGTSSFAIFVYEDPQAVRNIRSAHHRVGFSAGDEIREGVLTDYEQSGSGIEEVNVFRIDGMTL